MSNKGFIKGGKFGATNSVSEKNLGSPMGAETIVEVGIDPLARKRYTQLQESIVATQKNLSNMLPVLQATKQKISQGVALSKEQIVYFKQLVEMAKQKQEQLEVETKEMDEIQWVLDLETKASVQVTGEVLLGVRISISGAMLILNDSVKYCKFLKVNGDIKMMSL